MATGREAVLDSMLRTLYNESKLYEDDDLVITARVSDGKLLDVIVAAVRKFGAICFDELSKVVKKYFDVSEDKVRELMREAAVLYGFAVVYERSMCIVER